MAGATFGSLRYLDGTESAKSYAAVARRGTIVLGLKFVGVVDGARFGIADKTYVQARVRSARALDLTTELGENGNVVSLSEQQLTLTTAWPAFAFEKADEKRASCLVGAFVAGSLIEDAAGVIAQLEKGDVFRDIAAFTITRAGKEFAILQVDHLTAWLRSQAGPSLAGLKQAIHLQVARRQAQTEFSSLIGAKLDGVAQHGQILQTLFMKHVGCTDCPTPSKVLE